VAALTAPRVLAVAAVALLASSSGLPALAQDRPVTLTAPQPLGGPAAAPVSADAPAKPAEAAPGIKIDKLEELDPNSVGLLDVGAGGFGIGMWKGTPRALVEALLPSLPGAPQSVAGRSLYRRLLLSAAEAPAGEGAKDRPSLVAVRIGRLLDQGDVVSAQNLLRVVPQRHDDPAIGRARAEVAFLMNDNAGACAEVRARLGQNDTTLWRKAHVFCQLLAGDVPGANIGMGLLQEQGIEDAPFFGLARMLAGDKGVAVNGLEKPEPLHIAMMRAAKVQIPPAVVTEGGAAVLRAVALSPNADLDTRLAAAEQAEMRGAFEAEALRQLYLSVNFTPAELSGALSAAEKLSGPRARALLYRAARGQTVASAQAEIISRAFALARKDGRLAVAMRVMMPVLSGIEPGEDLGWFAADAGSAIYALGDPGAASKWFALALTKPDAAAKSKDGAARIPAARALWPMAQLAALPIAATVDPSAPDAAPAEPAAAPVLDAQAFELWWKAAAVLGNDERARRATRILSLAEALGARIDDGLWARLVTAPGAAQAKLPSAGLMNGLRRAAAARRIGETVLLALSALGADHPAKTDIRVLAPVVRALREAGLQEPARRLAVESVFEDQG
jgi:hypothetical protein